MGRIRPTHDVRRVDDAVVEAGVLHVDGEFLSAEEVAAPLSRYCVGVGMDGVG